MAAAPNVMPPTSDAVETKLFLSKTQAHLWVGLCLRNYLAESMFPNIRSHRALVSVICLSESVDFGMLLITSSVGSRLLTRFIRKEVLSLARLEKY